MVGGTLAPDCVSINRSADAQAFLLFKEIWSPEFLKKHTAKFANKM
ncbi:MAG TPA: hypothetical protein VHP36_00220 [Chitinispirillaceae bacterium]|nr:hypothetical protein [Chitinispirillaceae bacterium]